MNTIKIENAILERVERIPTSEAVVAKRHCHTPFRVKSCSIPLNDSKHNSRPLSEVFK